MRALVTGAAGFIGSHLTDRLLADGWEVVGVDDYADGKPGNLRRARRSDLFRELLADVRELGPGLFYGSDVVFHQACAKQRDCEAHPLRDLTTNALGTLNVLNCAAKAGVRRCIYASTSSVYGAGPKRVGAPTRPTSFYGVSKLAGEMYASLFRSTMDVVILRYFHVYGPRQNSGPGGGVVSVFLRGLLEGRPPILHGGGVQTRSFTWVGDVVEANLVAGRGTHNVTTGTETSIEELAQMCRSLVPGPESVNEGQRQMKADRFDVGRSPLDVEWTPLAEGLERTADWLRGRYG